MKELSPSTRKQLIIDLKKQIKELQSELKKKQKISKIDERITLNVKKSQARSKHTRTSKGQDIHVGEFFFLIDVTAVQEDVYIPISIASGKKSTGFVYQIEGTARGSIYTTDISIEGKGITQVTWGTLLYAKIPAGKTGVFRILIKIKGKKGKTYTVVITRTNYKLTPSDTRYNRFNRQIRSKSLKLV